MIILSSLISLTICPKIRPSYRELDEFEHKMRTQFHCKFLPTFQVQSLNFFKRTPLLTGQKQPLSVIPHSVNCYELNVYRSQFLARQKTQYGISHQFQKHWVSKQQFLLELQRNPALWSPCYYGNFFCPGETPTHFLLGNLLMRPPR